MRASGQRGSASIELAIVTVPVIMCTAAIIAAGRLTLAYQATDAAAYDAARTASLARTKTEAETTAYQAALTSFQSQGINCNTLNVIVNTTGFDIPVGEPATVSATVECHAALEDLTLPGLPMPDVTLTSNFVSPLDRYRSRS
ncbi:TadE family protein [Allorhizocola rhizosphaerae]|uniref:TadE family protein n=1 Tax=Allorhizocola rhizosphaerae TaxID=1872709 RepID=UPI000E3EC29F|nr:TadE family protein [Allorhizocola rhizosphaerae]